MIESDPIAVIGALVDMSERPVSSGIRPQSLLRSSAIRVAVWDYVCHHILMGRFSNEGRFRVVGNEWNYRILDTEYSAALEEVDLGGVVPRQLGPAVFRDIGDAHWTASELNGRRFPQEPAQASW
ncbi:MAG: hypothetical protein J2P17_32515, partial [Mycobacterium sp.]|nr:hypothetical protein [Mycobacterium sp.]